MFKTILKIRATRWVAAFLTFAVTLTFSYNLQYDLTAAQNNQAPQYTIAVVGIENLTDYELLQKNHGIDVLLAELGDVEDIKLISQEKVLESLRDLEPNPDVAISVGEAVGADAVIVGFVSDLSFQGTEQAELEVGVSMYGVADGNLLSEAVVVGRATRLGFSGTLEQLAELAIRDGVRNAVGFVFENLTRFGIVTMVRGNEVITNLSARDNVRVGAEVAIIRDNRQIASIEIDDVSLAHSTGKIISQKKGETIRAGDKTRVVFTPVQMQLTAGVEKVPKKSKLSPILMAVLAIGVIAAVSRGGNKAEGPNPPVGGGVMASRDGRAVVSYQKQFFPDYIPAPPVNIETPGGLAECWNTPNITPLATTAYDFRLSTSPKSPTIPGGGYTITFDLTGISEVQSADKNDLYCATCNTELGTWEYYNADYNKYQVIGNHYGAACVVNHFTPYVVIIDERIDPLPAPANFMAQCADGLVTLSWDAISNSNNTGYKIWNCVSTTGQCSSVKDQITDPDVTTMTYTLSNDVEVCYAVQGISSYPGQDALVSSVECATPSANPDVCTVEIISLISPPDGAKIEDDTPTFVFQGSGTMDTYMLYVKETEGSEMFMYMSAPITGEGSGSATETVVTRQRYDVTYSGAVLAPDDRYRWYVEGYQNNQTTKAMTSSSWYFTFLGDPGTTECCSLSADTKPDPIIPANNALIKGAQPILMWVDDPCATDYIVTVRNESFEQVYQAIIQDNDILYAGTDLVDYVTYNWEVIADNGCGDQSYGEPSSFKKMPEESIGVDLPIPQWASGGGLQPIIGGDGLVSLSWYAEPDPIVVGYAIYRGTDPADLSLIDIVYKDQLNNYVKPDSDCPILFSEDNPGYCDISVTNGERYYYKIASVQTGDLPGKQSVVQSVQLQLQRPELIGPGNVTATDVTASTPIFMWFAVAGVDVKYLLSLVDNSTGTEVWRPQETTATSITYAGPALENGKVYKWYVKALNSKVQSQDSMPFKFTKKEGAGKPETPVWCSASTCAGQDAYSTEDSNSSITIYWKKPTSQNIKEFYIFRCEGASGICSTRIARTGNYQCGTQAGVVCYTDAYLERGMSYIYNIEAVDSGATQSDPSETLSITLVLKGPTAIFPIYNQVVYETTPTFTWLEENGADLYHLQIAKKSDGFSNPANYVWSYQTAGTSVVFNAGNGAKEPLMNPPDPNVWGNQCCLYSWRVCSSNAGYPIYTSSCSNTMEFYKNLKPPVTKSPDTNEQIIKDSQNPVLFIWTKSPGAAGYALRLCKGQGMVSGCGTLPIIYQADVPGEDVTQWPLPDAIGLDICDKANDPTCSQNGTYTWEIRAYDDYGSVSGDWVNLVMGTNREVFFVVGHSAPRLISPEDGEVIGPNLGEGIVTDFYGNPTYAYNIVFQWTELGQTEGYILRVESIEASDDASATGSVRIVTVFEGEAGTPVSSNSLPGFQLAAGWRYRWNVTTLGTPFDGGNVREFFTGLPSPNLIAPVHGKQVMLSDCDGLSSALCLHFDWNGGEIEDENGIPREISGIIGAETYDVEILKSGQPYLCEPNFTPPPITPITNTRNANSFCDMSTTSVANDDAFSWRVRARDASGITTQSYPYRGIPGPWSTYNSFTVLIPAVVLASPPDNLSDCDPYNYPEQIQAYCTIVDCLDMSYYWSPIPDAYGDSCFRIEISDTDDFRNLIKTCNSEDTATCNFPCDLQQCYTAGANLSDLIPMTNGVVYYWRVGASVVPDVGNCGFSWVYSDIWEYLKRPPVPRNLIVTVGINDAALTWDPPANCDGSEPALSYPSVPPTGGGYLLYQETSLPDPLNPPTRVIGRMGPNANTASIVGLSPDTEYVFCITVVDASGFENHAGHISNYVCNAITTLPEEETP